MFKSLRLRVWGGLGFWIWRLAFRVSVLKNWSLVFRVEGLGFRVVAIRGLGFSILSLGFKV